MKSDYEQQLLAEEVTLRDGSDHEDGHQHTSSTSAGPSVPSPRRVSGRSSRSWFDRITKYILDPRRILHNFFLHFLLCLFAPGVLCFDAMFATFEGPLLDHLNISHGDFGLLFSLPTLLGIVSAPTAAIVLRYGATRVIVVSGIFAFIGCLVIADGVSRQHFSWVLSGRLVLSLFQSVLGSVASLVTFRLFKSASSRALAYSMLIFANRVGAISGFFLSGRVLSLSDNDVSRAVWLAMIPTGFCLFGTLSFAWLYRGSQTARTIRPFMNPRRVMSNASNAGTTVDASTPSHSTSESTHQLFAQSSSTNESSSKGFDWNLVWELPKDFWWLWLLIGCVYGTIIPFETIAVNFFQEQYHIDATTAGSLLSLCPALALVSPVFSSFIYEARAQVYCVFTATLFVVVSIGLMLLGVDVSVMVVMMLLGVGYMMATNVVWVLIPQVVPDPTLQTVAIGIGGVAGSLFIAVSNFLAGYIRDITGQWVGVLAMFMLTAVLGLASSTNLTLGFVYKRWGTHSGHQALIDGSDTSASPAVVRIAPLDIVDGHFKSPGTN